MSDTLFVNLDTFFFTFCADGFINFCIPPMFYQSENRGIWHKEFWGSKLLKIVLEDDSAYFYEQL